MSFTSFSVLSVFILNLVSLGVTLEVFMLNVVMLGVTFVFLKVFMQMWLLIMGVLFSIGILGIVMLKVIAPPTVV